ncbi:MAG TPA: hypothetical protein VMD99_10980 [Terriglobales bacterium]|nr:hypothetical protein [Terriglobales bacterium]
MKHSIRQFTLGLALLVTSLAIRGLGQSTPQQVAGTGWQAATTKTPAVASDGTNLYIAWTGVSNHEIYFAKFNGTEWTDYQVVGGSGWTAETSASPALTFIGGTYGVLVAWRGLSPNEEIFFSQGYQGTWTKQRTVSGTGWQALTKTAPAVAFFGGTLFVTWLGAGSPDIWYTWVGLTGDFAMQQKVAGSDPTWTAETDAAPVLTSFNDPVSDQLENGLFWKGSAAGHIWWSSWGIGWEPQSEISCPGASSAQPAAAYFSVFVDLQDSLMVFWKDESDEGISNQIAGNCGPVSGDGWTAQTEVAPAAAGSANASGAATCILAWVEAATNTILYIDPTTLHN